MRYTLKCLRNIVDDINYIILPYSSLGLTLVLSGRGEYLLCVFDHESDYNFVLYSSSRPRSIYNALKLIKDFLSIYYEL